MSTPRQLAHDAVAILPGFPLAEIRKLLVAEAARYDLPIIADTERELIFKTPIGTIAAAVVSSGLELRVSSDASETLFMLIDTTVTCLGETLPEAVRDLRWSNGDATGCQPSNFRFARVQEIESLCQNFLRVTLRAKAIDSYSQDAIHFRLILPPPGLVDIEWPSVGANEQIIWPEGKKTLHRPAYTARKVDAAAGSIAVDVFMHEGGRVTKWLRGNPINALIGMIGPGGGGLVSAPRICMFGDETAFPAIARILENLPPETCGQVVLTSKEKTDYPFPTHESVSVRWLRNEPDRALAELAIALITEDRESFFWFAAGKSTVHTVRTALAPLLKQRQQPNYISAYW